MKNKNELQDMQLQKIHHYWDEQSDGFDEEHNTEDLLLWKKELHRIIGTKPDTRILDVGTGTGFLALMLAELGYTSVGADLSDGMLSYARKKAQDKQLPVQFVHSACESLPFAPDSFDAVVNCRVMWTLMDPVAAVREWMRVLSPGGRIISFMRMMDVDVDAIYQPGQVPITLPLKNARVADYVRVYQDAGLVEVTAEELPATLSHAEDMPGWTAFCGKKDGE